ncbi:hypothetical protein HNP38_002068 [Chryseobacterium defluvii]|uniref:Secretion system C-terminal sorting domain-containing protein n=1 Tax=Chryseobacterium defluvii TaxID=160396 RepID=A0A840KIR1_9FLAO|nr:choice-of-anchor J domain-containing protein [Chryseobacterium defluvii]MBB4806772.1 hypothetical protein [Chryseobacterium defluvii]
MKKLLFSFSLLVSGAFAHAQTVLLDENFDSYTNFAITGFGSWLTLDLDGLETYTGGLPTGATPWVNAGDPQAFMIFNPTAAGVTNAATATPPDNEVRNFDAHSGQKYAAAWDAVPAGGSTANNDWLISPAVTLGASGNQLTLWVKSLSNTYGLEKYKVGVYVGSGTPTSSASFTIISGALPLSAAYPNWEQKTYPLDAYSGQTVRIGIQCVSSDNYMFMVDDVKIMTGVLSTNEVSKTRTNIFPNPTKGEINIRTDKKIKSSTLFDMAGKSLLKSNAEKIDISSLPKGTYLMQIEFNDGTTSNEKIIRE